MISHLRKPLPVLSRRCLSDKKSPDDKSDKPSDDKSDKPSDDHHEPTKAPSSKQPPSAGQKRLNELLASMSKESNLSLVKTVVAPKPKTTKKTWPEKEAAKKPQTVEAAVRDVAESIGGDVQQTESELLAKLLKRSPDAASGSISDLISGMQIDGTGGKSRQEHPKSRAQFVRKSMGDHQRQQRHSDGRSDEFQQRERFQRRQPRSVEQGNV